MYGIYLLLLSILTFLALSPCLHAAYLHWDDTKHIFQNVLVYKPLDLSTLKAIFTSFVNETYIPLTTLSFNMEFHAFGLNPFISHLINVLLGILIVLCVYIFTLRLGLNAWAALIAAGIFALHPMHVESIAWATERKDVLCALFYLLALISYQQHLRSSKMKYFWLALSFGTLSILSKAMAVSLPWVLLILDHHHDGRLTKKRMIEKLPFAMIIFPIAALTFFKLGGHPRLLFPDSILLAVWSAAFYIQKFFWPFPLLPLYSPDYPVMPANYSYWIAGFVLALWFKTCWLLRKDKLVTVGLIFFISTIFFFVRVDLADINVVADRFIYLPSVGICIILGIVLSKTPRLLPLVLALILGILTFNQCRIWQNDTTLWTHVLKHQPHNQIAKEKYKSILMTAHPSKVDYAHFDAMLKRLPDPAKAHLRRGNDLAASGDFALALDDFNAAIRSDPGMEEAYINRGNVYQAHGDLNKALKDFDQAIRLNPSSSAYLSKAILLGLNHQPSQALDLYKLALATNKDLDRALYERGFFFAANNECDKAIADFSAAIIHNKAYTESYFQRGLCALTTGNIALANADFMQVIALDPINDRAYGQLCRANIKNKQLSSAVKNCSRAIELFNFDAQYYNDRAKAYFLLGQHDKALRDMDRVIALDPQNTQVRMIRNQIGQFVKPK